MPPPSSTSPRSKPPAHPAHPAVPNALAVATERLDAALRDLIGAHEELLRLAASQRIAISRADARALSDILNAQAAVAQRVVELEQQRQGAVVLLTKAAPQAAGAKATISQLARAIADPARSRLLALAERLRDLLNRLHIEHMALRAAAESLSSHMEGLMRQVCRKLSHAGTYARSGAIDTGGAVLTALDVRS